MFGRPNFIAAFAVIAVVALVVGVAVTLLMQWVARW